MQPLLLTFIMKQALNNGSRKKIAKIALIAKIATLAIIAKSTKTLQPRQIAEPLSLFNFI